MADRFMKMLLGTTSLRTIDAVIRASESAELALLRKAQAAASEIEAGRTVTARKDQLRGEMFMRSHR